MKCDLEMGVSYKLAKMLLKTNVKVQTFFHQSFISTAFKMSSICTFKLQIVKKVQMVKKRDPYHSDGPWVIPGSMSCTKLSSYLSSNTKE